MGSVRLLGVIAKYKSKKVLDTGTTVYEYSDRQIAERHKEKADRIEKLSGSIEKLRNKVKADLGSKDAKTRLTALAIGLMDHTYERVGNDGSADEGHFGVTGWQKQHVKISGGSATIKYVGKSGVKQEKTVTDKAILKALKDAHKSAKSEKTCIFEYDDACVKASDVNEYLEKYDITAKDLRGFHANREMQETLGKIRKAGPSLPGDKKKREKLLKKEFQEALDQVAEAVGHEASTLRSQYLVPALEDVYLVDGKVIDKLNSKTAFDSEPSQPLVFADRLIRQFIDHSSGPDTHLTKDDFLSIRLAFNQSGGDWEQVVQGSPVQTMLLSTLVSAWSQLPGRKKEVETI